MALTRGAKRQDGREVSRRVRGIIGTEPRDVERREGGGGAEAVCGCSAVLV